MNKLDPNTFFSIFEANDELVYKEHQVEDLLENPYVLIGMVIRGLENYNLIDMMYLKSYPDQYQRVREIVKHKYFNGLYKYLVKLDSKENKGEFKIGDSFDRESVLYGLGTLLQFYEELEEYEKCAVIKRYMDIV